MELEEADQLLTEAQELKDESDRANLERAIEYADQAHTFYRRHNSPRTEEARQLVDEIYFKLKRMR